MAHLINDNEMFSVIENPWHKQGIVLDHAPTTEEALLAASLNWEVAKWQNFAKTPTGEFIPTESYSTVRTDKGLILGTVSDEYSILQNHEAFSVFDSVLLPEGYTYETAGAISSGKKVWIMAKSPESFTVGNDEVLKYFLLTTSHDGSQQVKILPTTVRVVCNNTLSLALNSSVKEFSVRHTGDVKDRITKVANIVKICEGDFSKALDVFNFMNETPLSELEVIKFFEKVLPDLKKRSDPKVKRNIWKNMFEILNNLFYYGRGNSGRSLWHAYNSITEYVDHYHGNDSDKRFSYSQFGSGFNLKINAFKVASEFKPEKVFISMS